MDPHHEGAPRWKASPDVTSDKSDGNTHTHTHTHTHMCGRRERERHDLLQEKQWRVHIQGFARCPSRRERASSGGLFFLLFLFVKSSMEGEPAQKEVQRARARADTHAQTRTDTHRHTDPQNSNPFSLSLSPFLPIPLPRRTLPRLGRLELRGSSIRGERKGGGWGGSGWGGERARRGLPRPLRQHEISANMNRS